MPCTIRRSSIIPVSRDSRCDRESHAPDRRNRASLHGRAWGMACRDLPSAAPIIGQLDQSSADLYATTLDSHRWRSSHAFIGPTWTGARRAQDRAALHGQVNASPAHSHILSRCGGVPGRTAVRTCFRKSCVRQLRWRYFPKNSPLESDNEAIPILFLKTR